MTEIKIDNTRNRFIAMVEITPNSKRPPVKISYDITCGNMADTFGIIYGDILDRFGGSNFRVLSVVEVIK